MTRLRPKCSHCKERPIWHLAENSNSPHQQGRWCGLCRREREVKRRYSAKRAAAEANLEWLMGLVEAEKQSSQGECHASA